MTERETTYLLSNPAMKKKDYLQTENVKMESLWNQPVKNLEFDTDAFEDLSWWIEHACLSLSLLKISIWCWDLGIRVLSGDRCLIEKMGDRISDMFLDK